MNTSQYESLKPREATPGPDSRLFSFIRIRDGAATRFHPGEGTRLRFANRDADTLEMPGVPGGYLAPGDTVTAHYRGSCVFRGEVATIVETRGRGSEASQTVTCVGPWSKMQRLVYRQYWYTGDGYALSSRLILNQTRLGAAQNLDSELYEIALHGATPCGYTVARADVSVSTQTLPSDECRDITVADAIRRELRFFPKAVCSFDYSGDTPALSIRRNASPTTAAYADEVPKTGREYVYNAHPITGVDLEIETTGSIDGTEYRQIAHQRAGDALAGNPDCLYATLQIRGASSSNTRQSFESVTEDIPADLNDAAWWKARHPRLANVASDAITITDGARSPANYPRIAAATAGELKEAGLRCEVSKFTCRATIATADDREEDVYLTLNYLTTNATGTAEKPKTYTWVTDSSAESGETVPSGLAATLLAERSGRLLAERMAIRLGDALPRLGDAIAEPDGTVFLQSFEVDCASLTADLEFGVPDYLSPEDMASLLSGFRNKRTTTSTSIRRSGRPGDGDTVEMGAIPPLSSSEFAPGTKAKTTVASSGGEGGGSVVIDSTGERPSLTVSDGGGSIALDLADLPADCNGHIAVRQLTYVDENGDEQVYHGLLCDDVDLPQVVQKTIVAGSGISVTQDGNAIKITNTRAEGGETSGFTGEKTVVTAVSYDEDSHQLRMTAETWTFRKGLLKSVEVPSEPTVITTAVEETV